MTVLRRVGGLLLLLSVLVGCAGPAVHRALALKVVRIASPRLPGPVQGCGSFLGRSDEGRRGLLLEPHGVVLLGSVPSSRPVRPDPGNPDTRWVGAPLPAPEPAGGRHVDIFYSPHPDDETLSAGVLLASDVRRGDRVIVVALTDGGDTRARVAINARLAALGATTRMPGATALTAADVGRARLAELRRATRQLGVQPSDVYAAHLDAPRSDCGSIVSVHEADQVERAFAARFPGATHITMSYDAERQQDHLAAGVALRHLLRAHVVTSAQWVVSRLWWTLPCPQWRWVTPDSPTVRLSVLRAASEYERWDPARQQYAVGLYSVREQFLALQRDQRDRLHGAGPDLPVGDRALRL